MRNPRGLAHNRAPVEMTRTTWLTVGPRPRSDGGSGRTHRMDDLGIDRKRFFSDRPYAVAMAVNEARQMIADMR